MCTKEIKSIHVLNLDFFYQEHCDGRNSRWRNTQNNRVGHGPFIR